MIDPFTPDLYGDTPVSTSIKILRIFEPTEGYDAAFSGGLDSQTFYELVKMAGVKLKSPPTYNITNADPPELIYFVRRYYPEVVFRHPPETLWQMIERKGFLPTANKRYCCELLKERFGSGVILLGLRSEESASRAARGVVQICRKDSAKTYVLPIKHWTRAQQWVFFKANNIPYCSLYDEGFNRLGCIMCPKAGHENRMREMARWPKLANAWKRAAGRGYEKSRAAGRAKAELFNDFESYWQWWISAESRSGLPAEEGCTLFDGTE